MNTSLWNGRLYIFYLWHTFQGHTLSFLWKKELHFLSPFQKQENTLYRSLKYSFPCLYFHVCSRQPQISLVTKNKMNNPRFIDEETIPLVDEDYDNYGTPNTSRVDETSFTEPDILQKQHQLYD